MSQKCKVLIIGEDHANQHLNEMFKPLLLQFASQNSIQPQSILCFSEGREPSNLFSGLFKNNKHMTEITPNSLKANPSLESIVALSAIFSIMKEIHYISEYIQRGKTRESLPRGAAGHYTDDYIVICFTAYGLTTFIDISKDSDKQRSSLLSMMNTAYRDALQNRSGYEEHFRDSLMNAIPYFEKYDSIFPATQMLQELIDAPLIDKQLVMLGLQDRLRDFRDRIMVTRITAAVIKENIKLVIMSVGMNHMHNLQRLFLENDQLFEMGDIQVTINDMFKSIQSGGKIHRKIHRKRQTKHRFKKRLSKRKFRRNKSCKK